MAAQSRQFFPTLAAVGRAEQRRVFDTGINRVGIAAGRLEVPDARELPRMRRAVVPTVRSGRAVVDEAIVDRLPRAPAVVRSLHDLSEPARRLRRVDSVRIRRRALHVVDLPAAEVRPVDFPVFTFAVRFQNERALARSDQYAYGAHGGSDATCGSSQPALLNGTGRTIARR